MFALFMFVLLLFLAEMFAFVVIPVFVRDMALLNTVAVIVVVPAGDCG